MQGNIFRRKYKCIDLRMKQYSRSILIVAGVCVIFTLLRLRIKVEIYTTWTETRDDHTRADNVQTQTKNLPRNSNSIEDETSFENEQIQAANQANTVVLNPHLNTQTNAGILNIYNISNTKSIDASLCVKSTTKTVFAICIWELEKDIYVSGDIYKTGQWEPVITQKMQKVLNQGRNITFVDIGANIGYFSLLAASAGHHVISVEPWEQHIQKIVNSIHVNKFEDRITIVNNAVSNRRRELQFYVPWANNLGAARLVLDNQTVENTERFSVTSIVLNDLADLILTKDVVIKIDIEGHECLAMEKADHIFDRFNVLFISMEWEVMQLFEKYLGSACPRENIHRMFDMLTRRGFIPYSFTDDTQLDIQQSDTWTFLDLYWIQKQNI